MKINQLSNFIAVVDYGSINKAAENIFVSQPNLSRSIQSLEEEMGKKLLERSNHGVSMTPTGRLLYYYSQSILSELEVLEKLKGLDEIQIYSKLSLSTNGIFLKDDLVLRCYEKLVSSETEIQINETTAEAVLEDVRSSKSELGLAILNSIQYPLFKRMADMQNIEVEVMGTSPVYIHINDKHELASKDIICFSELMDCTFIHLPADFFYNLNNGIRIDGMMFNDFPKCLVMSNYHAMLSIAKQTDSFMLGHKWQIDELKHSHMKSILLDHCDLEKYFVLLKRKNELVSDAGEILLDLLKNTYQHM